MTTVDDFSEPSRSAHTAAAARHADTARPPRSLRDTLKGWRAKPVHQKTTKCSFMDCTISATNALGDHAVCAGHYELALRRLSELLRDPDHAASLQIPVLGD